MPDQRRAAISWPALFPIAVVSANVACLLALVGCGGSEGIPRYELSGEVTYNGKPVPSGYVNFRPDGAKGNHGPASSAAIVDGKFETDPGEGTIGGPHIAEINGMDGIPYKTEDGYDIPVGRRLFPKYEMPVDLPKESSRQTFEVPVRPQK